MSSNIPDKYILAGGSFGSVYGESEIREAIAIAEVIKAIGSAGVGDATAANQILQIALETAIRDRLPSALVSDRLKVDGSGVTQPISGTVGISGTVPVSGTFYQATQPVSISMLPLPTNAATNALQITGNTSLATIATNTPSLGQAISSASSPVVIASDQTIPVTSTGLMPVGTTTNYMGTSAGANLKSSSGNVYSIIFSNLNAATRYFQLFNKASVPATNDVPVLQLAIPSGASVGFGQDILGGSGFPLLAGISWGVSTTSLTYTAAASTDSTLSIRWS